MSRLEMASHDRGYEEGVLAERERCIGILEAYVSDHYPRYLSEICAELIAKIKEKHE